MHSSFSTRYEIPDFVQSAFKSKLGPGCSFAKLELSGETTQYVLIGEQINHLVKAGRNLDQVSIQLYGQPFNVFMEQYRVYPYKIYRLLAHSPNMPYSQDDTFAFPYDIDFTTMLNKTLIKKTLPKIQGKPISVEYYEEYDNGLYSNIIARIDFELTYDALGFITQRKELLKFYRENDEVSAEFKDIGRKFDPLYDAEARILEGVKRRQSIIDNLQLPILGVLQYAFSSTMSLNDIVVMGREFLDRFQRDFDLFIKASKKDIITSIGAATDVWLNFPFTPAGPGVTVRQYIISELTISY